MKIYTSHVKPGALPVLVSEGFSVGAAFFGWLWLLWWRAWIAAAIVAALSVLLWRSPSTPVTGALGIAAFMLQGLFGRDLVRWSLDRSGYTKGPIVAAASHDGALLRLLSERADLAAAPAGLAR